MATPGSTKDKSWLELEGRVCVVTGAAGGIGSEIARELAAVGAKVALLDRDEKAVDRVAAEIAATGAQAIGVCADITDQAGMSAAADQVEARLGRCNVLVNNAAAIYADALMDVQIDKWNQLLSVNLTGFLVCSQVFGRHMIANGSGSIVHVASIAGHVPQAYSGAYSVSKAGVKMLSRLLSVELAEHRIRSNVVSPAMVRTPMSEGFYQNADVLKKREAIVPAGRISGPRDIAQAILFLASDRASYINGQDLLVDGGLTQMLLKMIPRPGFEKEDSRK